jgi:hypothetical protein
MTKEKAISCLAWLQTAHSAEYAQALDMAIKALKTEPTDKDLISKSVFDQIKWERDVAISQLHDLGYELGEKPKAEKINTDHYRVIDISYSPYTIDSTSNSYSVTISKTTEQPAARWEWIQYESLPDFGNYYCSKCRFIVHRINGYNYCPQCGVRMAAAQSKDRKDED